MIRHLLPVLAMAVALSLSPGPAQAGQKVIDLSGRTITVPDKVERIILGEGRAVIALGILDRTAPLARVVAVQVLAQWLHPDHFADLDPAATLREMTTRFQPLPLDGVFWTQYP